LYTVGKQIAGIISQHQFFSPWATWNHAIELLNAVSILDNSTRVDSYPPSIVESPAASVNDRRYGLQAKDFDQRKANQCSRRHCPGAAFRPVA